MDSVECRKMIFHKSNKLPDKIQETRKFEMSASSKLQYFVTKSEFVGFQLPEKLLPPYLRNLTSVPMFKDKIELEIQRKDKNEKVYINVLPSDSDTVNVFTDQIWIKIFRYLLTGRINDVTAKELEVLDYLGLEVPKLGYPSEYLGIILEEEWLRSHFNDLGDLGMGRLIKLKDVYHQLVKKPTTEEQLMYINGQELEHMDGGVLNFNETMNFKYQTYDEFLTNFLDLMPVSKSSQIKKAEKKANKIKEAEKMKEAIGYQVKSRRPGGPRRRQTNKENNKPPLIPAKEEKPKKVAKGSPLDYGCILAGGSIINALFGLKIEDFDYFPISSTTLSGPSMPLDSSVSKAEIMEYFKDGRTIIQTQDSISTTEYEDGKYRSIQVILRLYRSLAEVIFGFDLDSCGIAYCERDDEMNGDLEGTKEIYLTPRCYHALKHRLNVLNLSRASSTMEYRLSKYAQRGFPVLVPQFSMSKVNFTLLKHLSNLMRLYYHTYSFDKDQGILTLDFKSRKLKLKGLDMLMFFFFCGPIKIKLSDYSPFNICDFMDGTPGLDRYGRPIEDEDDPDNIYGEAKYRLDHKMPISRLRSHKGVIDKIPDHLYKRGNFKLPQELTLKVLNPGEQICGSFHKLSYLEPDKWYGEYFYDSNLSMSEIMAIDQIGQTASNRIRCYSFLPIPLNSIPGLQKNPDEKLYIYDVEAGMEGKESVKDVMYFSIHLGNDHACILKFKNRNFFIFNRDIYGKKKDTQKRREAIKQLYLKVRDNFEKKLEILDVRRSYLDFPYVIKQLQYLTERGISHHYIGISMTEEEFLTDDGEIKKPRVISNWNYQTYPPGVPVMSIPIQFHLQPFPPPQMPPIQTSPVQTRSILTTPTQSSIQTVPIQPLIQPSQPSQTPIQTVPIQPSQPPIQSVQSQSQNKSKNVKLRIQKKTP